MYFILFFQNNNILRQMFFLCVVANDDDVWQLSTEHVNSPALPSEAANAQEWGAKLCWRPWSGVCMCRRERQKASTCFICVCVGTEQQKDMSSSVSVLWLWLRVDLSPKLNFHSSLPLFSSLNLSPLPTARHFCFHMADFSGNTLIFVAFGVGSKVCCACQVFSLRLTPAPKLNCSVISCHPPSTTSLSHICQ